MESAASHLATLFQKLQKTAQMYNVVLPSQFSATYGEYGKDLMRAHTTMIEALCCKELVKIDSCSPTEKSQIISILKATQKKANDCPLPNVWASINPVIKELVAKTVDLRKRKRGSTTA